MNSSYTIKDWEKMGLLVGIHKDKQNYASNVFNFVLNNLTLLESFSDDKNQNNLIFSVVHRIIKDVVLTKNDIKMIMREVRKEYKQENYECMTTIDCEAQFISEYSERKIKELRNEK